MPVLVWSLTGLLVVVYLTAGLIKALGLGEKIPGRATWTADFAPWVVRMNGALEVAGAVGLVIPWLTGVAMVLTPLAAVGLGVIQLLAIPVLLRRRDYLALPFTFFLLLAEIVIAVARFSSL